MKLGIVGLAQSGKTTVFEALTHNIEENTGKKENRTGMVHVPDERVNILSDMYNPKKTIFAQVEYFLPVVPQFEDSAKRKDDSIWAQIRTCDALIHVVRNFELFGEAATPIKDVNELEEELRLMDLLVVEKRLEKIAQDKQRGKKISQEEIDCLEQCKDLLENDQPLRVNRELADHNALKSFAFLSGKPILVIFNNDDDNPDSPDGADKVDHSILLRGRLERELAQMEPEEAEEFLKEFSVTELAKDVVIAKSYELLGLMSFFTVGEDEVRAWTIPVDTDAVDAAEVIHSDIKRGFIRAEVLAYNDLMDAGSFAEARKKGTVRLEGKTYKVVNGDIVHFRFNV
jgi:GTP-binding protein YchF